MPTYFRAKLTIMDTSGRVRVACCLEHAILSILTFAKGALTHLRRHADNNCIYNVRECESALSKLADSELNVITFKMYTLLLGLPP